MHGERGDHDRRRQYTLARDGGAEIFPVGFLAEFTYAGIFLVLFLCGLGLPLPEEVTIVTAGVLAHAGVVRWWLALPVCLVGVLSGDVALYWTGRRWGPHVLDSRLARHALSRKRLADLQAGYRRYGVVIVFGARHVMGLRAAAFLAAGVSRVPFARFLFADGAAVLLGVPVSFTLAYLFSSQVWRILHDVRRAELWAGLAVLVALVVWLGVLRRRARVLQ